MTHSATPTEVGTAIPRTQSPKIVTANELLSGAVVYQKADGGWTRDLAGAELIADAGIAERRLALAAAGAHRIVGAYLADCLPGASSPAPAHFREAFRANGPSNYPDDRQEERCNG